MTSIKVFELVVRWRWLVIIFGCVIFCALVVNAPNLRKDTSADAFIDPNDSELINRNRVEEIFNIADPIVVAVVNKGERGIYNAESLKLVAWLTEQLQKVDNIDPDQVKSLATESNIVGTQDGMEVEYFYEELPDNPQRISWIESAINNFPLYQGTLVAKNGQATLIVAELLDENVAAETYQAVMDIIQKAPVTKDTIHVSGEGAVAGYLSAYIDNDAKKLNPLAALIITIILYLAFRTVRGALIPNVIVIMTAGGTIGAMAAFDVDFYAITNGLIVCMIGIAVADSVHIFSQYYQEILLDSKADGKTITLRAMVNMWQPITLTTFTTIAGFSALAATTTMPPIYYFGLFGALAVFLAWFYSMTMLPAILSFFKPIPSKAFRSHLIRNTPYNFTSRMLYGFGQQLLSHPKITLFAGVAIALVASYGATLVEANEERIANFKSSEAIYIADKEINQLMDGTYYFDIFIETDELEGIYSPDVLKKIEETQRYLESLDEIKGTTSVVDFIKQMHKAVNENQQDYYRIPDDKQLIAQLFFLYAASGDPTAFEEQISGERDLALIRATLTENTYATNKTVVTEVSEWLETNYTNDQVRASITGDIPVSYHWIHPIMTNNLLSVVVCGFAVVIMASLLFQSFSASIFAIVPVAFSILLIYAVMGVAGIWLSVSTSMFASIAIGLGVDFSVHTTHSLKHLLREESGSWINRLSLFYAGSGRAQFYNFLAIALGFGALITSDVPPLIKFGSLVAVSVSTAFFASIILLPVLALLLEPKFLKRGAL